MRAHLRSSLSVSALALLVTASGCLTGDPPTGEAAQAAAPAPDTEGSDSEGRGWWLEQVPDEDVDDAPRIRDSMVLVIRDHEGLVTAPIPESIRHAILAEGGEDWGADEVLLLSPAAMEAIALAEANGVDDPEVIDRMDGIGAIAGKAACSNVDKVWSRSFSQSGINLSTSGTLANGLTGSVSVAGTASLNAGVDVGYTVLRVGLNPFCVPYAGRMRYVHANAAATTTLNGSATGTLQYSTTWQKQIATIPAGSFTFWVGPLPVKVGFNIPISAGFIFPPTSVANINLQANGTASGAFDATCTFGTASCTSSASFNLNGGIGSTTGQLQGRAAAHPWVEVALQTYLYSPSTASAQIGVKPTLYGDLWGYFGDTCGDANGDGVNETVHALTFDLDAQAFVTARAVLAGNTVYSNSDLWHSSVKHLLFTDLANSTALTPMIAGPSSRPVGIAGSYTPTMRPCWPYANPVQGTMTVGGGAPFGVNLGSPVTQAWATPGMKTISVSVGSDTHGRNLGNKTTSRSILVFDPREVEEGPVEEEAPLP